MEREWRRVLSNLPNLQTRLMLASNASNDYQDLEDIFNFSPPHPSLPKFRIVAALVYGALAILGLVINLLFCVVVWRADKLHTVTHMLMTNLAASNLLFLLFHPPYYMSTYILESNWRFGTIICKTSFSIGYVTVTSSFYFMSLVAIDRWLAIFKSKFRMERGKCVFLTVCAWIVAGVVAAPYIYNSEVLDMNTHLSSYVEDKTTRCGGRPTSWERRILIATFLIQYCLPLAIMIPAYGHIAYFLWRRPTVGVQTKERTRRAHARRKRLIFTLIGILVILIMCWSPLFSVGIMHRIRPKLTFTPYIITSMIALLGVVCTPLCYLTNDGFSQQLHIMFPWLRKAKLASQTPTRRLLHTKRKGRYESAGHALTTCSTAESTVPTTPRLSRTPMANQTVRDVCETHQ